MIGKRDIDGTCTQRNAGAPSGSVTTLFTNRPDQGQFFRPAGTVLASDGTTTVRRPRPRAPAA